MSEFISSFRQSFIVLSPSLKLVVFVIVVLLFWLFGSLLAMIIAVPAFHYEVFELLDMLTDPNREDIAVIKFLQIFQSINLFIIPSLFAAWLFSEKPAEFIFANRISSGFTILLVLFSIISAIPFLNYVTELNSGLDLPAWMDKIEQKMIRMEETAAELTELFLETNSTSDLIVNLIMVAILPAIGEEFLFRGLIQRLLVQWFRNGHAAIITTAFLFSFIHFQFFGFVPRFLLGLYFGYLLVWSGSIWLPVLAHLINNGLAVFYYHYAGDNAGNTTIDNIGTSDNSQYLLYVSIFITSLIIGVIYLREKERSAANGNLL
ncbi:MAG TPA: CPBP family intramembrane glutamic endopeptidase [Bacteroidales bacterium]|jgi:hypothetical protein|nr:CPBP family intramembrane glutamic endopeptidase [Bacteroidales bacterium]